MATSRGPYTRPRPTWSWQDDARCSGEDLYLFFGRDGEKIGQRIAREQKATAICGGCPVRPECLLAAFERKDDTGVWGGLGEAERVSKRRSWIRSAARRQAGVA